MSCNGQCYVDGGGGAPQTVSLKFKYLVSADGAKRSVVKALGALDLAEDTPLMVEFDHTQLPIEHTKHVVVTYQIPEGTDPTYCSKMKVSPGPTGPERLVMAAADDLPERAINPCPLAELRDKYGWTGYTRPHSQIYATRDVVYIGAEMPEALSKDRAKQKEYATLLLRDSLPEEYIVRIRDLPCDVSTDFGKKKDMLSISAFDIELGDVNRTVIPCGNIEDEEDTGVIFIMGDARKNPLYTTGTGAQTGVREVMHFDVFLSHQCSPAPSPISTSSTGAVPTSVSAPNVDNHTTDAEDTPVVLDRGPDFDTNLGERLSRYHASVRAILDHIAVIQDNWIERQREKNREAGINHHLFSKNKDNIELFFQYIHKINEVIASQAAGTYPDFLLEVQTKLSQIRNTYHKVFACAHDEASITSYNGMNIETMLQEVEQFQQLILAKYPTVDDVFADKPLETEMRHVVAGCYDEFMQITKHLIRGTPAEHHTHDDHRDMDGLAAMDQDASDDDRYRKARH